MKFKKFFLQRVLAWALTILIGVTSSSFHVCFRQILLKT